MTEVSYQFTNQWFQSHQSTWLALLGEIKPQKILEIGSYEGQATCWLIDEISKTRELTLHCVDTWQGGLEHQAQGIDMRAVEQRFRENVMLSVSRAKHRPLIHTHKGQSHRQLAELIKDHEQTFDLVYVDGSHQAADVLTDAVLAYHLTRPWGVIVFDDYLWQPKDWQGDPRSLPKPAIDAWINQQLDRVKIIPATLGQLYVQKLS